MKAGTVVPGGAGPGAIVPGGVGPGPGDVAGAQAQRTAASKCGGKRGCLMERSSSPPGPRVLYNPGRPRRPARETEKAVYCDFPLVLIGAMNVSGMPRPSARKGTEPSAHTGKTRLAVDALPM